MGKTFLIMIHLKSLVIAKYVLNTLTSSIYLSKDWKIHTVEVPANWHRILPLTSFFHFILQKNNESIELSNTLMVRKDPNHLLTLLHLGR